MTSENGHTTLGRWQEQLRETLTDLSERQLLRSLRPHQGLVDFCSNDYLSLNSSGLLFRLLERIVSRHEPFVGSTGSRLIRGHYEFFERAQAAFAAFTGFPAALLFQSGYAANTGVLPALVHHHDTVFCDALLHASLLDGVRLSGARRITFAHNDPNDLEARLRRVKVRGRRWIVSETLFSMDGDSPELRSLVALAERHEALLVLDEAHAIGVCGPQGRGLVAEQELQDSVAVAVYPCGKALGLAGAFVCGSAELREVLVNRARSFVFSTAQPPLLADLLREVVVRLPEMETARARVLANADYVRRRLGSLGPRVRGRAQIVPVVLGSEAGALAAAAACLASGLDVRAIRPPSVPRGESRIRVTVQADHLEAELDLLCDLLVSASGLPPTESEPKSI